MGNSEQVARRHYLQVTDQHFEAAIEIGTTDTCEELQEDIRLPQNLQETAMVCRGTQTNGPERIRTSTSVKDTRT